jgi:hypothetical protein
VLSWINHDVADLDALHATGLHLHMTGSCNKLTPWALMKPTARRPVVRRARRSGKVSERNWA